MTTVNAFRINLLGRHVDCCFVTVIHVVIKNKYGILNYEERLQG